MAASEHHDLDRIFLVAPSSTPERLARTVEACRGFVYAASTMGVTGARDAVSPAAPGWCAGSMRFPIFPSVWPWGAFSRTGFRDRTFRRRGDRRLGLVSALDEGVPAVRN